MQNSCYTEFSISGDFNPEEITKLMGIEPHSTFDINQYINNRSKEAKFLSKKLFPNANKSDNFDEILNNLDKTDNDFDLHNYLNESENTDEKHKKLKLFTNECLVLGKQSTWDCGFNDNYDVMVENQMLKTIEPLVDKVDILNQIKEKYNAHFTLEVTIYAFTDTVLPCISPSSKIIDFCHSVRAQIFYDIITFNKNDSKK